MLMLKQVYVNFMKASQMSQLALSASFIYQCYGSRAIINIIRCQCGDRLPSKVGPELKGLRLLFTSAVLFEAYMNRYICA